MQNISHWQDPSSGEGGRPSDLDVLRKQLQQARQEVTSMKAEAQQHRDRAQHEAELIRAERDTRVLELATTRGTCKVNMDSPIIGFYLELLDFKLSCDGGGEFFI